MQLTSSASSETTVLSSPSTHFHRLCMHFTVIVAVEGGVVHASKHVVLCMRHACQTVPEMCVIGNYNANGMHTISHTSVDTADSEVSDIAESGEAADLGGEWEEELTGVSG